jgi:flagellar basal body-associated protein FliL
VLGMEGNEIDNYYSPEQQPYPEQPYPEQQKRPKKKGRIIVVVIGMIIVFFIGVALSPFIMDMFSEDKPDTPFGSYLRYVLPMSIPHLKSK